MTEVRYSKRNDCDRVVFNIYACGHSRLYENEVDVGCRCASMLISALVNAVDAFDGDKSIVVKDGVSRVEISVPCDYDGVGVVEGAYFTARQGFKALSQQYPDNFVYEEKVR